MVDLSHVAPWPSGTLSGMTSAGPEPEDISVVVDCRKLGGPFPENDVSETLGASALLGSICVSLVVMVWSGGPCGCNPGGGGIGCGNGGPGGGRPGG